MTNVITTFIRPPTQKPTWSKTSGFDSQSQLIELHSSFIWLYSSLWDSTISFNFFFIHAAVKSPVYIYRLWGTIMNFYYFYHSKCSFLYNAPPSPFCLSIYISINQRSCKHFTVWRLLIACLFKHAENFIGNKYDLHWYRTIIYDIDVNPQQFFVFLLWICFK